MAINLAGRLMDDAGNGINGATVEAIPNGLVTPDASTVTANDGSGQAGYWYFTGLGDKLFRIVVSYSGKKREVFCASELQFHSVIIAENLASIDHAGIGKFVKVGVGITPAAALHTYSAVAGGAEIRIEDPTPRFTLKTTGGGADEKNWDFLVDSTNKFIAGRAKNDADTLSNHWVRAYRSGYTISAVVFPSGAIGPSDTQQHTLPAVASDIFCLIAAAQTLTNKTLTTPTITSPSITGTIGGVPNLAAAALSGTSITLSGANVVTTIASASGEVTCTKTTNSYDLAVVDNTTIQKVSVRYNSGSNVGSRQRINFIPGSNVSMTVADSGPNDEVSVTINAADPGSVGYNNIYEEGVALTQRQQLNFIGAALTAADDVPNTRTNVTLSQSPSDATSLVGTTRTVNTTTPLSGGGNLGSDKTISLAGLSTLGASNQVVGIKNDASGWEYKTVSGTANHITLTHGTQSITLDVGSHVVQLDDTQTLTNKTLTSPTINGTALSGNVTGTPTFTGAFTMSGQPSFSPTVSTAPFAVGANGQGVVVTGLNADQLDGEHAAAFSLIGHTHSSYISTTRTINTTSPLSGGGDMSGDRTFALAGLSTLGTSNYVVGVNSGGSAWEYKNLAGTSNHITVTHSVGGITLDLGSHVVQLTDTQTLTNKTLTTPTIGDFTNSQHNHSNAAGGGAISGMVSSFNTRTGAVVPALNDYTWAQINKTTSSLADITTRSHTALSDIGTNSHATIDTHLSATATHGATGAVVGTTNTQTLTNKTLTTPIISSISNTGTVTLPTATDTLVGRATTDTLTNKTFDATSNVWIKLSEITLDNDIVTGLSFNSISGTYQHLKVVACARLTVASAVDNVGISFNDSLTTIDVESIYAYGTTVTAGEALDNTVAQCFTVPAGNATTYRFGQAEITFSDYAATSHHKTFYVSGGQSYGVSTGQIGVRHQVGVWVSTAAITDIYFYATGGCFKAGTTFTLYAMP